MIQVICTLHYMHSDELSNSVLIYATISPWLRTTNTSQFYHILHGDTGQKQGSVDGSPSETPLKKDFISVKASILTAAGNHAELLKMSIHMFWARSHKATLNFNGDFFPFLKDLPYLFSKRLEGRERKREGKINWLPHIHAQTKPTTQACALTGNRTGNLLFHSTMAMNLSLIHI